jgi:hypothetical protein
MRKHNVDIYKCYPLGHFYSLIERCPSVRFSIARIAIKSLRVSDCGVKITVLRIHEILV